MKIEPMDEQRAFEYIKWQYDEPYVFYNIPLSGVEETIAEVKGDNGIDFYSVLDDNNTLFGMYEYSFDKGIMNIGLGIRPDLCGRGNGRTFVRDCISYGRKKYAYIGLIRLMVVDFNVRAIHLYHAMGFVETKRVNRLSYGVPVTFIVMELNG